MYELYKGGGTPFPLDGEAVKGNRSPAAVRRPLDGESRQRKQITCGGSPPA
ncbi:MAG: hypothetical protein IKK51_07605 [Oscillospiraceae bacterium]|nr:hypothetical protein [Oscillospiraceae bacterium]